MDDGGPTVLQTAYAAIVQVLVAQGLLEAAVQQLVKEEFEVLRSAFEELANAMAAQGTEVVKQFAHKALSEL